MSNNDSSPKRFNIPSRPRSKRIRQLEDTKKLEDKHRLSYYETRVYSLLRDTTPLIKVKMNTPTISQMHNIRIKALQLYLLYMEILYHKMHKDLYDNWIEFNTKLWNETLSRDTLCIRFMLLAHFILYVEDDLSKI